MTARRVLLLLLLPLLLLACCERSIDRRAERPAQKAKKVFLSFAFVAGSLQASSFEGRCRLQKASLHSGCRLRKSSLRFKPTQRILLQTRTGAAYSNCETTFSSRHLGTLLRRPKPSAETARSGTSRFLTAELVSSFRSGIKDHMSEK